jgi:hypothetical protein
MDDKTLADAVVALGIKKLMLKQPSGESYTWTYQPQPDNEFVRDPRVAMALMEKIDFTEIWMQEFATDHSIVWVVKANPHYHKDPLESVDESLPRAIILACVEALNGD